MDSLHGPRRAKRPSVRFLIVRMLIWLLILAFWHAVARGYLRQGDVLRNQATDAGDQRSSPGPRGFPPGVGGERTLFEKKKMMRSFEHIESHGL